MLTDKWKQAKKKVGKISEKFVDVDWRMRNKEFDCRKIIYVYQRRKIDLNAFWKNNLNLFWSLVKTKQYKTQMHQHVCTTMLLHLMINFNLVKNIISLCFHEHKNWKLTHYSSISKKANFRVLQQIRSNLWDESIKPN
jgi:hypothetical protein